MKLTIPNFLGIVENTMVTVLLKQNSPNIHLKVHAVKSVEEKECKIHSCSSLTLIFVAISQLFL